MIAAQGLLGGTFDPVHNGHLKLADAARQACGLEQVLFIPSASPPHKRRTEVTPFSQRVEMLQLATAGQPFYRISEVEARIQPPSYSIDMLRALRDQCGRAEYAFIIGDDAFLEVTTWKSYKKVLQSVDFIVVSRKGVPDGEIESRITSLGYSGEGRHRRHAEYGRSVFRLKADVPSVSSTEIRNMPCNYKDMMRVVPKPVCEYIIANGLYRCR